MLFMVVLVDVTTSCGVLGCLREALGEYSKNAPAVLSPMTLEYAQSTNNNIITRDSGVSRWCQVVSTNQVCVSAIFTCFC